MNNVSRGQLVYVPSGAKLYAMDPAGDVSRFFKLKKPANLLITSVNETTFEVLYEQQRWLIQKSKTYGVKND